MAGFYEYTSPDEVKTTFFVSDFTGDGVSTSFTLSTTPYTVNNTQVYIDGVYQEKTTYSVLGTVLTFSGAPPNESSIEVTVMGAAELQVGTTSADLVSYVPETGGVTDVQTALRNISASADLLLNQFTGNGSLKTFTLSSVAFVNNTLVYFNGIYQSKSNYTVSSDTPAVVTFSTAPPSGAAVEIMVSTVSAMQIGVPSDNTVTTAKIANSAVTAAKIASDPISVGITTVVTSASVTATVNTHVYVSAAGRTITLPASPTIGQRVLVTVGNFTNTVVARNGSKIMSSASDFTMDAAYLSIQFIYTDATQGWVMS